MITGAATGIGQATAVAFAREGARLALIDLTSESCRETMAMITRLEGEAIALDCDVADPKAVASAVEETIRHFGRLDFAFNNAGIANANHNTADTPIDDYRHVMSVNLDGVFYCMKYQLPHIEKVKGAIVNCSSILGAAGFMNAAPYVASKHGVIGLTRAAAVEYGPKGVRVNAVCPAFIITPMLKNAGILDNEAMRTGLEQMHALKRMGTPEEVANAVLWLCDPANSFTTGIPLMVDGGYTAM
jgi:NAD(P)-dependent dehydrogenase (short-subunit alcohol dehydrogenase family)